MDNCQEAQIRKIRDQKDGMSFFDALRLAGSMGTRLARNSEFDAFFSRGGREGPLTLSHNAWTETVVAYPGPKKPFGDAVEWNDHRTGTRYHVDTKEVKGQKGIALAFEGCDIITDGATLIFAPKAELIIIGPFPQESGFYAFSPPLMLPYEDGTEHQPSAPMTRHLTRDNNNGWAGPLVRSYSRITYPDNLDQELILAFRPSLNLGIFVAEKS